MFKTPDELKSFLLWAQANKIKEVKIGEIHAIFSDLAFLPDDPFANIPGLTSGKKTLAEESLSDDEDQEEDPDLFWSAQ